MSTAQRLFSGFAAAALLAVASARAAEPEPVATSAAASTGAPVSVAQQIDEYLKTSPAAALPKDAATGVTPGDEPRKVHGMVDVAVGTNGYRSAFVQSDIPVGKTGTLSIAVGKSHIDGRGGPGFGPGYGAGYGSGDRQTIGLGLALGGATLDPHDPRCRQIREDGQDLRFDGDRPRADCATSRAPTAAP